MPGYLEMARRTMRDLRASHLENERDELDERTSDQRTSSVYEPDPRGGWRETATAAAQCILCPEPRAEGDRLFCVVDRAIQEKEMGEQRKTRDGAMIEGMAADATSRSDGRKTAVSDAGQDGPRHEEEHDDDDLRF